MTQWQAGLDEWGTGLDWWSARLKVREAQLGLAGGYWDPDQSPEGVGDARVSRMYVHW